MIELLETRRLFSKIPLLLYSAPNSVASAALSVINSTPAQVFASAAGIVASGQKPTQEMLDAIEYHEGYSLSIYPDANGDEPPGSVSGAFSGMFSSATVHSLINVEPG